MLAGCFGKRADITHASININAAKNDAFISSLGADEDVASLEST